MWSLLGGVVYVLARTAVIWRSLRLPRWMTPTAGKSMLVVGGRTPRLLQCLHDMRLACEWPGEGKPDEAILLRTLPEKADSIASATFCSFEINHIGPTFMRKRIRLHLLKEACRRMSEHILKSPYPIIAFCLYFASPFKKHYFQGEIGRFAFFIPLF